MRDGQQDLTTTDCTPAVGAVTSRQHQVQWRAHVFCSPDPTWRGTVVNLGPDGTTIGRHDAPWTLADPALSRHHARLQVSPDGVLLLDHNSRNGTFVAGRRIRTAQLGDGAVVRMGATVWVLEADSGQAKDHSTPTANIPGHTEQARLLRFELAIAAAQSAPVLLVGETGTGKEFAAAELHRLSGRQGPLVRLNVAAVPADLFESELFGHLSGAFTGATGSKLGRIREANGGTLVLDEMGALPLPLQAKLLRVLEDASIRPLGASKDVPVDVRFVASTNADLRALVEQGGFRRDLLARLGQNTLNLAPLGRRRGDLLALADAVAPLPAGHPGSSWSQLLTAEAVQALAVFPWTDNLRALRGILSRAAVLGGTGPVGLAHLGPEVAQFWQQLTSEAQQEPAGPQRPTASVLRTTLARVRGNIDALAREFGVHRRQVYRWMDYTGIERTELQAARERQLTGGEG